MEIYFLGISLKIAGVIFLIFPIPNRDQENRLKNYNIGAILLLLGLFITTFFSPPL